ncbi:hypothetical protein [Azohydromonas australica]|uniref:hypothetical protein n=1 Tax=Azohydromonas australica TaxID=364039 RepID=UPI0012EC5B50|nr:hypothetical protein [Azohydromonas australica]
MEKHTAFFTRDLRGKRGWPMLLALPVLSACGWLGDHVRAPSAGAPNTQESATPPSLTAQALSGVEVRNEVEISDTYWAYAALAAHVYATKGVSETLFTLPLSWNDIGTIKVEEGKPSTFKEFENVSDNKIEINNIKFNMQEICRLDRPIKQAAPNDQLRCAALMTDEYRLYLKKRLMKTSSLPATFQPNDQDGPINWPQVQDMKSDEKQGNNKSDKDGIGASIEEYQNMMDKRDEMLNSLDDEPINFSDCDVTKTNKQPKVPLTLVQNELGWRKIKAIDKYEQTAPWKIFIPELAIDVWERKRDDRAAESFEYALVYRGTAGWGGWMSNLQILSTLTPLVWDQYRQAIAATRNIVRQIYFLHMMREKQGHPRAEILITTIGHSLGAGLAEYAYYRIPQVTKAVGFNPTPVDGAHTLIGVEERQALIDAKQGNPVDHVLWRQDPKEYNNGSIYLLAEKGDIIGKLSTCQSGILWGAEGGPTVACESINMSKGSFFRQHDMRQMACKLAFVHINRSREAKAKTDTQTSASR